MRWMLMPLRRYADFSGRSRRREFWLFVLGTLLANIVFVAALAATGAAASESQRLTGAASPGMTAGVLLVTGLWMLLNVALFVPSLAVQVRRLHDQDKSGWMILLSLIPLVGGLFVLVLLCLPGTEGENGYGPDPRSE